MVKNISKFAIVDYAKESHKKYLHEIFEPLPNIKMISSDKYHIKSLDEKITAYVDFLHRDVDSLYGLPKLNKTNLRCYEIQWIFTSNTEKQDRNASSWIKVTGTIPKLIEDFSKKNEIDVIYYSGLIGTNTAKMYSSKNFISQIEKIFANDFRLYIPKLSAQPKFFLIKKDIDTVDEINTIKENISSKRYSHFTEDQIWEFHNIDKFPYKNIHKFRGIKKWEIIKEQIDRIILRRLYKIKNKL